MAAPAAAGAATAGGGSAAAAGASAGGSAAQHWRPGASSLGASAARDDPDGAGGDVGADAELPELEAARQTDDEPRRSPNGRGAYDALAGVSRGLAVVVVVFAVFAALGLAIGAAVFGGDASAGCAGTPVSGEAKEVPARLVPIYLAASERYRLGADGPAYLAAINKIETRFGRNLGVSSAGALGWMQFMPATWATYGVDADGDGRRNPSSPDDAIHAAARYLRANGAPASWAQALYAYNHAGWYVREVSDQAARYRGLGAGCATDGTLRARIIAVAQSQLGVRERPRRSDCTPYGPCGQWCAMFTTWVWQRAGIDDVRRSSNYYVPNLVAWAQRRGLWKPGPRNNPQPGDMAVFARAAHVSLVERVLASGSITTINANGIDNRVARRGPTDPAEMAPGGMLGYIAPPTTEGEPA